MNYKKGDRVRILRADGWPELAGTYGTVQSERLDGYCGRNGHVHAPTYRVQPDAWGRKSAPNCELGTHFRPSYQQIEKLVPEGYALANWDDENSAWKPTPELRAAVNESAKNNQSFQDKIAGLKDFLSKRKP